MLQILLQILLQVRFCRYRVLASLPTMRVCMRAILAATYVLSTICRAVESGALRLEAHSPSLTDEPHICAGHSHSFIAQSPGLPPFSAYQ
jgi:hypothetical protein